MVAIKGFSRLGDLDSGLFDEIEFAIARAVDDPVASAIRQRRFLERLVDLARRHHGLGAGIGGNLIDDIREVEVALKVNQPVSALLHAVRRSGNDAAHYGSAPSAQTAQDGLWACHELARWFAALHDHADLEPFAVEGQTASLPTSRQLRREATRLRKVEAERRIEAGRPPQTLAPGDLVAPRPGGSATERVVDSVPDETLLRWVYFATPTKADRSNTYELAYERGVVCCDAHTATGALKPNVGHLAPGDLLLLVYGQGGRYQPELYLRVDRPAGHAVDRTRVMTTLPSGLAAELERVGYRPDPLLKAFTGFFVTPCGEWKGRIREEVRKPMGQNFLRTWSEVKTANGW
jgi:hypothetical protein